MIPTLFWALVATLPMTPVTIAVVMVPIGAAILRHHAAISVTPFLYTVF